MIKKLVICLIIFCSLLSLSNRLALAAGTVNVTPSLLKIDLKTEPAEFVIYYQNQTSQNISLTFKALDFNELTETRGTTYRYALAP